MLVLVLLLVLRLGLRVRLGLGTLPNPNPSPSPNLYKGEGGHFRARSPSPILNRKANPHALTCTKARAATQPRLKRAKVSCGESTSSIVSTLCEVAKLVSQKTTIAW